MFKVVTIASMTAALGGCSDLCSNTVVQRANSPDGQRTAVMFQRDCGATTGFSTQVSILDIGAQQSGAGNTYRADDDHGKSEDGAWGGPWAELRWLSPTHLLLRYAIGSRIFEQDGNVSGVRISYQAVRR